MMTADELDRRAFELAVKLERSAGGQDGAVVIVAGCFLLAAVVLQTEREKGRRCDATLDVIMRRLEMAIEQLREDGDHVAAGVH